MAVTAKMETRGTANISQCECLRYLQSKVVESHESHNPPRQQAGFTLGQNAIVATKVDMCCMQRMWLTSVTEKVEFNATVVDVNVCVLLYLKLILSLSVPARTMVGLNSMFLSCESVRV